MPKINILPKEVYSLIAAGEVVERPSSIVKEMIENSIDADAKNITIEIKNGGTTYIRITDNGCGIAREDVEKVFVSHATSKISTQNDLDSIMTLGFRGEAMASIAAVSKVELLSKADDEEIGTRYEISGGEKIDFSDAGCPSGTTIIVRDIFFNTPARMKFLKKDVTEGNSVAGIVERIALSHPEISFRFIRDGKQVLLTSGNGSLKSTIYSVFGKALSDTMMEIDYSYQGMRVTGYASKPHESRKSRAMQYFFINGRFVKSRTAMAALEQAYKNYIMVGRFPACVLNIEMDARLVDVNVHPAKIEVRFQNEKPIFELIHYAVKTAIETKDTIKEASFPERKEIKTTVDFFKKAEEPAQLKFKSREKAKDPWIVQEPLKKVQYGIDAPKGTATVSLDNKNEVSSEEKDEFKKAFENAPQNDNLETEVKEISKAPEIVEEKDDDLSVNIVGEAFKTYIIVEIGNDLYYIDKHAAHERMNFERFKAEEKIGGINSQILLSPVAVKLAEEEYIAITENIELLSKCGFSVEDFGNSSVIVRETPSLLDGADVEDLILEIAEKLLSHKTDIEPDKMDWIFHSASCRGAVKGGDYTSPKERELFVKKLLSMPNIRYCPHGRPVMIKISKYEIEKQFGRIQ